MSAAMSAIKFGFLSYVCVWTLCGAEYVPVKVEIETNEGGVPPKIFTAEEIAKYDASDVSKCFVLIRCCKSGYKYFGQTHFCPFHSIY